MIIIQGGIKFFLILYLFDITVMIKKKSCFLSLQVVSACREVSGSISVFTDMLVQCCFCNETLSFSVIHQVMVSVIKSITKLNMYCYSEKYSY